MSSPRRPSGPSSRRNGPTRCSPAPPGPTQPGRSQREREVIAKVAVYRDRFDVQGDGLGAEPAGRDERRIWRGLRDSLVAPTARRRSRRRPPPRGRARRRAGTLTESYGILWAMFPLPAPMLATNGRPRTDQGRSARARVHPHQPNGNSAAPTISEPAEDDKAGTGVASGSRYRHRDQLPLSRRAPQPRGGRCCASDAEHGEGQSPLDGVLVRMGAEADVTAAPPAGQCRRVR